MQTELIKMSKTPQEFITRLYSRDVDAFERSEGQKLTYINQMKFLKQNMSSVIRENTKRQLTPISLAAYTEIMELYQDGERHNKGWKVDGPLLPCEDRCKLRQFSMSKLGTQPYAKVDGYSSFLYGEGFLSSQWTFDRVKR